MDRGPADHNRLMRRAAVLGHPVSHSLSPALHRAAYVALGLDWSYDAIDIGEAELAPFLASLGDEWAGLSLTMPLKLEAARLADFVEPQSRLVGPVNTLVPTGKGGYRHWVGANTDIHGIVAAFAEAGSTRVSTAAIVGAGATATSAMAALASMGATSPLVLVRDRSRAGALMRAATRMGVSPRFVDLASDEAVALLRRAEAVVTTIPADGGAGLATRLAESDADVAGVLLDVVYVPRVTPLSAAWADKGGTAVSGVRMLLHQAGEQVRLMTGLEAPLEEMDRALANVLTNS